ncbi:AAA domain-containing protein [Chitinophaga sancti]|uniref:AAA domain-containing protein n=1 Tax=Chitinophaga sancti TaxID=1004 RepID=A0A1K1S7G6_9BACT|nr:AAA domain-containing protein [Chitinophaga sancti]WQD62134.1 AAA domain-containing protein [Chitinophaga sancti]WQG92297.1 AAA domain-containing protein [Chitinophaga sancti]SFW80315.1 Superfamily I DNA and/or RNA helicase [Chitinophaga sancti]
MKIKNIQQYRSFYKNEIRDLPTRDEHFIGNFLIDKKTGKKKFGWFEVYHGDKEGYGKAEAGIENFLQSFLDMAKDGQAVYEFLQNAVDAGSTHYTMVWGKDEIDENHYLLVANNGRMFNLDSIRSILNVGSSTKTADSQTIGKFGIGFKLAHRLVGKDNGLQELINENSGPILFSWKNYDLESLAKSEPIIPSKIEYELSTNGNFNVEDDNPWLFKILITCFPCLPENDLIQELPKMANGIAANTNPFSKAEYEVLTRWVKNNQRILNKDTYSEGALFFIKLGSGKESELSEINLKEGVKFALAILKETADTEAQKEKVLHTVQLNNEEPITYPDLEYIKITVHKEAEQDTYAYIRFGVENYNELTTEQKRRISEEANIESLLGFRKHNEIGDYFKGAPNLYLYFPLSEEVHNFNYILHSNAFYKGSSRTFLHKGSSKEDGINERLLKTIANKIDSELNRLSASSDQKDRQLFLHFYAALLTSTKSTNQDRLWIEEPYINRINLLLKKYIPVRRSLNSDDFTTTSNPENVYVKKTTIEIDTQAWGLQNVNWFYWIDDTELSIRLSAFAKLGIKDFAINNLLSIKETISANLNNWIGNDESKITSILSEIALLDTEVVKAVTFKNNLFNTKLLKFNNEELLSINEFQEKEKDGYFIIFNRLNDIKDLLQKLDLKYTKENFDDFSFNPKYFNLFANDSHVRNYTILTRLFSKVVVDEKLNTLNKSEKYRIFEAFRTFNESPGERMGELKLFKNNNNNHVCFKNLYSSSSVAWLSKYCISNSEDNSAYKNYLLDKPEELYQGIIYPFWVQIANHIASNPEKSKEVLDDIVSAYEKSNWQEKGKNLLRNWEQIIFKSEVIESEEVYFNNELTELSNEVYKRIQVTALKYYDVHIPDKFLLPYLDKPPFSITSITIEPTIEDTASSVEHINDLLLFSKVCNIDFFSSNCVMLTDGIYYINSTSEIKQIATTNPSIVKYINTYYPNKYILIPEIFSTYRSKIALSDNILIEYLITLFDEKSDVQELDLIEVVLPERYDDKKALLEKLTFIQLDATWSAERKNELYVKLLKEVVEGNVTPDELSALHKKISIKKDDQTIIIGDIDSAHDSIEVQRGDRKITLSQSQILNLDNAGNIKLVQAFHDEAKKRDLLTQTVADSLFKISNVGITDELVAIFNGNLESKHLENAHQLLFVWLSGKFNKENINEYSLKSKDGEWYKLEGQLIIYSEENEKYIKPSFLLNERYNGLQSLLQLSDLEAFNYNDAEDDIIVSHFLFVKGCTTDVLESTEQISDKLDYLYKGWLNLSSVLRDYKRNQAWDTYLNISPNQFVLNGIQVQEEILPNDFISWCKFDKKKEEFFKAIGVYVGDSPIEKVRKYLTGKIKELPVDIEIERFNETLLLNSINGLAGSFTNLNNEATIYNENKHHSQLSFIEKIINHLASKGLEKTPTVIYNTTDSFKVLKSEELSVNVIDAILHDKLKAANGNNLNLLYKWYNILKRSTLLNNSIIENCDELKFKKTFVPSELQSEHDEPFYHNWKAENGIRLFREAELNYDISIDINGETASIGKISEGMFYIDNEAEGFQEIFYTKKASLEELSDALSLEHDTIAEAVNDLIRRRNIMLTSIYNTLNSAGKSEVKSSHLEALESAFKEENLKQERKELIESIKANSDYSYIWFESYLKLLLTYESKQDTTTQKSISFQEIKRFIINDEISNKYFLLCGANSLIPLSIEDFEDFKITLVVKNRQNENIKVEGVSKKGQDLLIYCREPIPQTIINTFPDVIQVRISFSPVIDLLERLYKAFVNRDNMDEWIEINDILPNLQFIYGPPGTGKTTTLCSMILDEIKENYNAKYLLLTPTNKAADVLCKKLVNTSGLSSDIISSKLNELNTLGKSITITRVGKPTDPELEELDEDIYQDSLTMQRLNYTNILASTIHRIPYFEVIDEEDGRYVKLFKLNDYWDYIVFDEASMTNLPYLVFSILAIYKVNPKAKFIIAGDPKQIPPVVDVNDKDLEELDIQDENVYTMMGINSFRSSEQNLRKGDTIKNLDRQYRSIKKVGQLFSDLSYNNLLQHDREEKKENAKPLPEAFKELINQNVTFIDFPLNAENSIFRINRLLYSSYHTYSAVFVAELIKYFDSLLADSESWTIGLIAPYKAQAILLNKLITSYGISDKLKIYSDTVHGFQGDECDIVFFVSNPNNYYYTGHAKSLLSKEYIYNVAISRAKDYLIILHPFEAIRNNPFINSIITSYERNFEVPVVRKSEEFEKIIFNQKDYIQENSYITGHDNINVFGQIEMKYFIKANEGAIDIQLRKL